MKPKRMPFSEMKKIVKKRIDKKEKIKKKIDNITKKTKEKIRKGKLERTDAHKIRLKLYELRNELKELKKRRNLERYKNRSKYLFEKMNKILKTEGYANLDEILKSELKRKYNYKSDIFSLRLSKEMKTGKSLILYVTERYTRRKGIKINELTSKDILQIVKISLSAAYVQII